MKFIQWSFVLVSLSISASQKASIGGAFVMPEFTAIKDYLQEPKNTADFQKLFGQNEVVSMRRHIVLAAAWVAGVCYKKDGDLHEHIAQVYSEYEVPHDATSVQAMVTVLKQMPNIVYEKDLVTHQQRPSKFSLQSIFCCLKRNMLCGGK